MSKVAGVKRGRKSKSADNVLGSEELVSGSPQKSMDSASKEEGTPKKKKALDSRFGGMTEEQIMEMLLPDHLKPGLDIVFVSWMTLESSCVFAVVVRVCVCV